MKTKYNLDKVKICLAQPHDLFDRIRAEYYGNGKQSIHFDGWSLSFDNDKMVNDKDITARLIMEGSLPVELGSFVFNKSQKYGTKCFFSYNTKILYSLSGYAPGSGADLEPYNYFVYPFYAFEQLNLSYNNVTELELACDTEAPLHSRIQSAVGRPESLYMVLLGKNIKDPNEILNGYFEFYQRSRKRKAPKPTLYIHPTSVREQGRYCELKIYDKARELLQSRPDKDTLIKAWDGMNKNLERMEVHIENKLFQQFLHHILKVYPSDTWVSPLPPNFARKGGRDILRHKEAELFYKIGMFEELREIAFDYFANLLLHFKLHNRQKDVVPILAFTEYSVESIIKRIKRPKGARSNK